MIGFSSAYRHAEGKTKAGKKGSNHGTVAGMSKSSVALNNLRAVVIVVVLAFHSVLAYLGFLGPSPFAFDAPPYEWTAFPIVDSHRWVGFDMFCAWQDVYLMALFFFLSALFTWPSLKRKRPATFLKGRFQRLGVPFLFGVVVVMPIALYPVYRVTATDPSVAAYIHHFLALPFWPNGPLWFLWQLLALTIIGAGLFRFAPRWVERLAQVTDGAARRPLRVFMGLVIVGAIAYVPLALAFTPFRWTTHGPLALQYCRPLFYIVVYVFGLAVGANGLDRGLLTPDGMLPRHWAMWLAGALASLLLWMGLTKLALDAGAAAPLALRVGLESAWVLGSISGCFFVLGAALRFGTVGSRVLDNLAENAFGMYLFHYVFVVWLQYALLGLNLAAVAKGMIVFTGTLAMSWLVTSAVRSVPGGALLIGVERRVLGTAKAPAGAIPIAARAKAVRGQRRPADRGMR